MKRGAFCRPADNPFSAHRIEALRFRHATMSWSGLEERLEALGGKAALVGPKGSGKTTLLEELAGQLSGPVTTVRISGGDPRPYRTALHQLPERITTSQTILIDSAEQLGSLGWTRFFGRVRRARRVVATFHRPGRLPTLMECSTSPALLRELVHELVPKDADDHDPGLDVLFRRHDGNIRSCLRELYDVYAGRITT